MTTSQESLKCPITYELFSDPVLAEDGHTYEREAIERWIRQNGNSPLTRQPLSLDHLYPNHVVKKAIADFEASLREKNYRYTLGVDVKKKDGGKFFETFGKLIYHAEWLTNSANQPKIVLLVLNGARAKKEASFHAKISRHPHIVRTFGFVLDNEDNEDETATILLQELAPCGTLFKLLRADKVMPKESVLIRIFLQIIDAMIYLALNHIVHGDLACRNILVFRFDKNDPKNNIVKVTDFGLSQHSQIYSSVPIAGRSVMDIIPIRYVAPEILSNRKNPAAYTEKSDVYTMGILMWEAYSRGSVPWSNIKDDEGVIKNVLNGKILPQPSNCSQNYWNVIVKTWSQLPDNRPTFQQLKDLLLEQCFQAESVGSNFDDPNGDRYIGPLRDGKKHGHGIYLYRNRCRYVGEFDNDRRHGKGNQTWPNGMKYEGTWMNDKKHGSGTLLTETGDAYVGEWIDGKMNGEGVYTWQNGNRYEGTYKDDKKHGYGIWQQDEGSKYAGNWLNDKMHGQGVRTYINGNKYEGFFQEGKKHGSGTLYYSDGSMYVGNFAGDQQHGEAVLTFPNGDRYEGTFNNGIRHGLCTYYYASAGKYVGTYTNDSMTGQGVHTWLNGDRYEGCFQDGNKHGLGTYFYTDGKKYEGNWIDNKKNGYGIFTLRDGDRYEGNFQDGNKHGLGTYYYANGEKYVGNFFDDKINGTGVKVWTDGNRYEGSFKDGKMHGHGTSVALNGEKYVGEYAKGEKNGQGIYTYANGNRYEGSWSSGECHGKGKLIFADGRVLEGNWSHDKFMQ